MSLTDGLNTAQKEAVTAPPGPVLVLAGPGSGKTRVLTHRIAYLIDHYGIAPWNIMAVTFTNKASREMRERIEKLMDGGSLRGIQMGTFHSTCARLLRRETTNLTVFGYQADFVIFDADDQKQVMKQVLKELNLDEKKFQPRNMLTRISKAKERMITPEFYESADYISEVTKRVYTLYQATLVANNAMDFDDLLFVTVRLFDEVPGVLEKYQAQFQHILVDEFQDTNGVQYSLITRLAAANRSLFIVGDSDQSIYKWRGADYRNLKKFRDEFPECVQVLLEENYRSTQLILDAAKAVIQNNKERVHKDLFTQRKGGGKIAIREAYNETEEADFIVKTIAGGVMMGREPGDHAVMYRTNAQSRALEEAFLRAGLPYRLVGATRFYGRREIKDLIAYLRLIHNPRDEVSLRRIINTPKRAIGKASLEKLEAWGRANGVQAGEAVILIALDRELEQPFSGRALNALTRFGNLLNGWIASRETLTVGDLVARIIEQIDFHGYLDDGTDEGRDRWANVLEFKGVAESDPTMKLPDFLEQIALVADVDNLEAGTNAPTLLTLHASKGLEFPVVFIAGVEDGILPHSRTLDDMEEMQEERRLFYVGITRAEQQLYLLHAFRRSLYGMSNTSNPSRFLGEIPTHLVEGGNQYAQRQEQAVNRMTSWDNKPPRHRAGSVGTQRSYGGQRGDRYARPAPPPTIPEKKLPKPRHQVEEERKTVVAQYKTGQKVAHAKFGEGVVIESKVTGNDEEVTVAFPGTGIKRLAASFAKLEVLSAA